MMKLKSAAKYGVKTVLSVSAALFAILFVLRLYQTFALTDPSTGFFTDKSNVTVPLFYILAIGSVIAAVILAYLSEPGEYEIAEKKNVPHAIASLIFAIALAVEGIGKLSVLITNAGMFGGLKLAIKEAGGYAFAALPVFALLGAAAMIMNFASFLSGKLVIRKLRILSLTPVLWAFFLTISYFTVTASYLKVTQLMVTIFADVFLMLFLFEYARLLSGIGDKEAVWSFFGTGAAAVGLLLCAEIPNLIFAAALPDKAIVNCPFRAVNLAGALFTASAMLMIAKNRKKEEK